MRILIDNCVALNNGDMALITALANSLDSERNEIYYNTMNYEMVKNVYPLLNWNESIVGGIPLRILKKISKIFGNPSIWKRYIEKKVLNKKSPYYSADVIISAPGGYLHSYYGIEERLYILYLCKLKLGKPVGIFSQSLGNLTKDDQQKLKSWGGKLDFIFLRDNISYDRGKKYGLNNIYQTYDASFLLPRSCINVPILCEEKIIKVGISMRFWNKEDNNQKKYFDMMEYIVKLLINRYKNIHITFISTCQGYDNYIDDSEVAKKFLEQLPSRYKSKCIVDHGRYTLKELQCKLKDFDFTIGTRLHFCILSLLSGVISFNISYEDKGREVYSYLGMERYTINFNADSIYWNRINDFLSISQEEISKINNKISEINESMNDTIKLMWNLL